MSSRYKRIHCPEEFVHELDLYGAKKGIRNRQQILSELAKKLKKDNARLEDASKKFIDFTW
jgi:metal-responsive CopG/Arc/MetJ family transcriptional regulator